MLKKLWRMYQNQDMIRPTVYLIIYKGITLLLLGLLWERFLDHNGMGLGYVLTVLALVLLATAWFHYLSLDGVRVHLLPLEHWREFREKRTVRHSFDIIDFVNEKVRPMEDLEPEERHACRMVSSLAVGLFFLVAAVFCS